MVVTPALRRRCDWICNDTKMVLLECTRALLQSSGDGKKNPTKLILPKTETRRRLNIVGSSIVVEIGNGTREFWIEPGKIDLMTEDTGDFKMGEGREVWRRWIYRYCRIYMLLRSPMMPAYFFMRRLHWGPVLALQLQTVRPMYHHLCLWLHHRYVLRQHY